MPTQTFQKKEDISCILWENGKRYYTIIILSLSLMLFLLWQSDQKTIDQDNVTSGCCCKTPNPTWDGLGEKWPLAVRIIRNVSFYLVKQQVVLGYLFTYNKIFYTIFLKSNIFSDFLVMIKSRLKEFYSIHIFTFIIHTTLDAWKFDNIKKMIINTEPTILQNVYHATSFSVNFRYWFVFAATE